MTKVKIEPEWKSFKGWKTDITEMRSMETVPQEMIEYINFINTYTGVNIGYISNGPGREQLLKI